MASIVIAGDTSGSVTISAPAIAGTPTLTLPTTSGTLVVTGGAQTVQFAAGSAASPSITFTGDTNTGIFSPTADTIAFSEGGVESMRIDASGNVGIGTTTPSSSSGKLVVSGVANVYGDERKILNLIDTTALAAGVGAGISFWGVSESGGGASQFGSIKGVKENATSANYAGALAFVTSNSSNVQTERMRITSGGNLGIGITNPDVKLVVFGTTGTNGDAVRNMLVLSSETAAAGAGGGISFGGYYDGTSALINDFAGIQGFKENSTANNYSGALRFTTRTNGNTPVERMRIDSSGNLLVNRTSGISAGQYCADYNGNTQRALVLNNSTSVIGANIISFASGGSVIASITQTGASQVTYSTSSDYRLKENIAPMTGALEKVAQLKPVTYTWKSDGSAGQGFIAHELQAVVPDAVTGEKDAVELVDIKDEDGNVVGQEEKPAYQGVDTSFLVATLTAAIQELNAKVEAQAAEIAALKGAN